MTDAQAVERKRRFDDEELRNVSSWDDAAHLVVNEFGGEIVNAAELGNGFEILENKDRLVGVPCIFLEWTFNPGDYGDEYVSVYVFAKSQNGETGKYVVNDGGSGIRKQLQDFKDRTGRTGGLVSNKGLRRSDYEIEDPETGKPRKASTYYIDTSAS